MNVYIIKKATGEILSVNRTIVGVAMEAYGLDVSSIEGEPANQDSIEKTMAAKASSECLTSDGQVIIIERHFLGN